MNYLIYPLKTMNITQTYNDTYSHRTHILGNPKDYPIDDNCGSTSRDYFYCPCEKMTIKKIYGVGAAAGNTIWLESDNVVNAVSFNDYVTIMVVHPEDEDLKRLKVGDKFSFKEKIFQEGMDGKATGNHFHIVVGKGKFKGTGWTQNNLGDWIINTTNGPVKPEDAFYIDSDFTAIKNSKGLNFKKLNNSLINYGYVTCNSLNVREGASIYQKAINTLVKNTKITILDQSNDWYKIGDNEWVNKNYISKIIPNKIIYLKEVITNSLNVRKTPNGSILKTKAPLKKGTIVSSIKESGKWTMIDNNRWVYTSYLK